MEQLTSRLQDVPIKDITVTKNNPRKTFVEDHLEDLAESIKQKGVLQPVLLRPKGKKFEMVCGERRYRAAKSVGLEFIPANIRELDDDEAFEMMIIENLERKDVHPMEEAEAFKRMIDSGKYSVEDIAAKMARPAGYIAQRLKLVDLIEPLKKDFFNGEFSVGHARLLSRISPEHQKEIHHDAKKARWSSGYGTVSDMQHKIDRGLHELKNAPFKINDADLVPCAGSCEACPKRSGANPLLFPDIKDENICFDSHCYDKKLTAHMDQWLDRIIEGGEEILLGKDSYSDTPKFIQERLNGHKITVLDHWNDFNHSSGKEAKRLLWVTGHKVGLIETVKLTPKAAAKGGTKAEQSAAEQVQKIQDRAKRALELDNEKIEAAIRNEIVEKDHALFHGNNFLQEDDKLEMAVTVFSLYSGDSWNGYIKDWLRERLGVQSSYGGPDRKFWDALLKQIDENLFFEAIRRYNLGQLTNGQAADRRTSCRSEALYQLLHYYCPDQVKAIQVDQDEKAQKRIERTEQRLEKLKEELPKKPKKKKDAPVLQDR